MNGFHIQTDYVHPIDVVFRISNLRLLPCNCDTSCKLCNLTRRQLERYLESKRRKSIHFSPEQVYNRARLVVNSIDTEESIDLL